MSAETPLIQASQDAVLSPTESWPLKSSWWVGDVWSPLIEVLDPRTHEPFTPTAPPTVQVLRPDTTTTTASVSAVEGVGVYRTSVPLILAGTWTFIVTLPAPASAVQVVEVYANPLPS